MTDEHIAHVIDATGVQPTRFTRSDDGRSWSNAEEITIKPGGVLDLGNGLTVSNGQSLGFTYIVTMDD